MNTSYPYLEFLKIAKECREVLVTDTLDGNSPDLYDALYSNTNSTIHDIKLELYEIKWIELHWKKISDTIERKDCSVSDKKDLISIYAKLYSDFVNDWNYTEFDTIIFEERMSILKALISVNNEWEQNLKRMKVSFERSRTILEKKIKELETEEEICQQ